MTRAWYVLALSGAFLIAGCGSAMPVPATQMTASKADIRAAEEVGAPNIPQAALHLKMARDQITDADALIKDSENEKASLVLDRADADAQLAIELTHAANLKAKAADAMKKVQELKKKAAEGD